MFENGSVFGNYIIEGVIGAGASGTVYAAHDQRLSRKVALKIIHKRPGQPADYEERLAREAQAAAMIESPFVVKVWESATYDGHPYISLELVAGDDLRAIIDRDDLELKKQITAQIAQGIKAAHAVGLIHRDLKPENIKLTTENQPKILDFGLAKTISADSIDNRGNIAGTLNYLSPEQLTGEPLTYASDIFSFGVLIYELYTGRRPFEGDYPAAIIYSILHEDPPLPSSLKRNLPDGIDAIVMKMLAKRTAERYQTIDAVLADMEKCLRGDKKCELERPRLVQTVTVVDIKNLIGEQKWENFCVGFTENLINELSRRTDLIISGKASTSYSRDIAEVFMRCRTDFVIVGTLTSWQEQITLHLKVHSEEGRKLIFGHDYSGNPEGIFKLLSTAVEEIALALAAVTGFKVTDVDDYFETDITAYEFYLKGKKYYETNKPDELVLAEKMYKKALEIDINLAHAHAGLSDLYTFQYMAYYDHTAEKINKAKNEALKAIAMSPQLPEAYRALGRYHMSIGDYVAAEECLRNAITLNPKYAIGYRTLAWLKETMGDHEDAIYWARLARKYSPNDVETLLLLSLIHMDIKKYTIAMSTLQRALELAPDYGRAYYNLGIVYMKLGVLDLALENMLMAIKYKGDPNAHIDSGYIYLMMGQIAESRQQFEASLKEGFFPFVATYHLGYLEKLEGNEEMAAQHFRRTLELVRELQGKDEPNPHVDSYLAMSLAALGEKGDALAALRRLENQSGGDGSILYNIARGYALLGDLEMARSMLMRAVEEHAGPTQKEILPDPHFRGMALFADSNAA